MSTALIGLVGVVVGGLLSGGVAYALARRDEVQRRRASARLVLTEIGEFRFAISKLRSVAELAVKRGESQQPTRPPPLPLPLPEFNVQEAFWGAAVGELNRLTHPLWSEHRPNLARYLPDDAWLAVSTVYEQSFPRAKTIAAGVTFPQSGREASAERSPEKPGVSEEQKAAREKRRAAREKVRAELEQRAFERVEGGLSEILRAADAAANALGPQAYDTYSKVHTPGAASVRTAGLRRSRAQP